MTDDELEHLINRCIDCQLTPDESLRLNALLRDSAEARRIYCEHLNLDSALADLAARADGEQAAVRDIVVLNQQALFSRTNTYVSIAVASIASLLVGIWFWPVAPTTFATVVRGVGIETLVDGAPIGNESTRLSAGTLELVTVSGARVVIEAPAQFAFESAKRLNLVQGRLTAFVPPSATGFTVVTPTGHAIDLGTKFAVDVASHNESEIHVFEGEVIASATGSQHTQRLTANNAIRFRHAAAAQRCDFRQGAFVTAREVLSLAEALRLGQRDRAQKAGDALKQDPALLAWLDFDQEYATPEIEYGAIVHGARRVQGRFPGTGALDFVKAEDCVQLDLKTQTPTFTLMTWIRLNQLEGRINSLYSTDEWGELGQVHWMIGNQDNIRFAIKGTVLNELGNTNVYSQTPFHSLTELERWVHLALAYDSVDGSVSHYLNGVPISTTAIPKGLVASLGAAQLGNWKPQETKAHEPRRRLSGRMDEFVAFSRALSASEISAYYEASKPYQ